MKAARIRANIEAHLAIANDGRRVRTINYREAVQAVREALADGWGYVSGGTVAAAYRYPASQTQVGAMAYGSAVVVRILETMASRGTGLPLPWRRNTSADKIAKIIAETIWTPAARGEIRLSRRQAVALVADDDREQAAVALARVPEAVRSSTVPVSVAHSLAAGNCERETLRVAAWFGGRATVPACELMDMVSHRSPALISFASRAIEYACSHPA